ncbi:MAG: hypothetical protein HYS51_00840 [Candidatus Zambryskibacteria bacterium]|nr:hypothetical protein [Candidatus Zambryskibacteria bacterium]
MKKIVISALAFAPTLVFAQQLGNLETLLNSIKRLVNLALPIVVALGLLGFFWGLVQYIFAAGDETKKEAGKNHMIWGIVALFVMVSVWGLVQFIGTAFNIQQGGSVNIPTVPGI